MGFRCGIVGLPNAGKSTVFNALTAAGAEVAPYPFSTVEPHVGVVPVPDERLKVLADLIKPKRVTPTTLQFVDIAGLVKGASRGEGLGNQFLAHIRDVDAVAHVVRCFEDQEVPHPYGSIDPRRDAEVVNLELVLADLEVLERRLQKVDKLVRTGDKAARREVELLRDLKGWLEEGRRARDFLRGREGELPRDLPLITAKPFFYVANLSEGSEGHLQELRKLAEEEGVPVVPLAGKVEAELQELEPSEREEFRRELGLEDSGLRRLVEAGYGVLELITFFTTVNLDLRAWTVKRGTKAPQAAGKIHSDMERGFIRAEVISFEDFVRAGSEQAAREKGLIRSEGRDYEVRDGDIIHFRFNV